MSRISIIVISGDEDIEALLRFKALAETAYRIGRVKSRGEDEEAVPFIE